MRSQFEALVPVGVATLPPEWGRVNTWSMNRLGPIAREGLKDQALLALALACPRWVVSLDWTTFLEPFVEWVRDLRWKRSPSIESFT